MTKTETIKECKRILRGTYGAVCGHDFDFLKGHFSGLTHWRPKTQGFEITKIEVAHAPAPFSHTKCFYITRTDGLRTDFSYRESSNALDVKRALRSAIQPEIDKVLNSTKYPTVCPVTGDRISKRSEADVDHYDLTFAELANLWIDAHGGVEHLAKFINDVADNSSETCFTDDQLIKDFVEWHNANTHLRLVTKKANRITLKKKP